MAIILGYGSALEFWRSSGASLHTHAISNPFLESLLGTPKSRTRNTDQAMQLNTEEESPDDISRIISAGKVSVPVQSEDFIRKDIAFRFKRKPPTLLRSPSGQMRAWLFSPMPEHPGRCLLPASVITTQTSGHVWRNCVIVHQWARGVPKSSLVRITWDCFVSTPEFVFLQMATELPFLDLVLLGFELCSSYSPTTSCGITPGAFNRNPPLTTKAKLTSFIDRCQGSYGSPAAKRALKYVIDKSASVMETKTVMMLCLPYRMGGYGLPLPQMNAPIQRRANNERISDQGRFFCDLLWRECRLAIEYDSDCFHANSAAIARDARRRNALESMGWKIVTVTNEQIKNADHFDRVARQVAKALGKRLRFEQTSFNKARAHLRKNLLSIS